MDQSENSAECPFDCIERNPVPESISDSDSKVMSPDTSSSNLTIVGTTWTVDLEQVEPSSKPSQVNPELNSSSQLLENDQCSDESEDIVHPEMLHGFTDDHARVICGLMGDRSEGLFKIYSQAKKKDWRAFFDRHLGVIRIPGKRKAFLIHVNTFQKKKQLAASRFQKPRKKTGLNGTTGKVLRVKSEPHSQNGEDEEESVKPQTPQSSERLTQVPKQDGEGTPKTKKRQTQNRLLVDKDKNVFQIGMLPPRYPVDMENATSSSFNCVNELDARVIQSWKKPKRKINSDPYGGFFIISAMKESGELEQYIINHQLEETHLKYQQKRDEALKQIQEEIEEHERLQREKEEQDRILFQQQLNAPVESLKVLLDNTSNQCIRCGSQLGVNTVGLCEECSKSAPLTVTRYNKSPIIPVLKSFRKNTSLPNLRAQTLNMNRGLNPNATKLRPMPPLLQMQFGKGVQSLKRPSHTNVPVIFGKKLMPGTGLSRGQNGMIIKYPNVPNYSNAKEHSQQQQCFIANQKATQLMHNTVLKQISKKRKTAPSIPGTSPHDSRLATFGNETYLLLPEEQTCVKSLLKRDDIIITRI